MKILNKIKARGAIVGTAEHFGETPEQVRAHIEEAIEAAWNSDDPEVKALQAVLFPCGRPTPEEFIAVLSSRIKS